MILNGFELFNMDSILELEDGSHICRVPKEVWEQLNPAGKNTASISATGSEIRFVMNEGCDEVRMKMRCWSEFVMMQLYYGSFQGGWKYLGCKSLQEGDNEIIIKRPDNIERLRQVAKEDKHIFSPDVMRLCFRSGPIGNLQLEGDVRPPRADEVPEKSILFYGSSVTHGSLSHLPCGDYASLVSDALGMDRINKGMPGACHLEHAMADYIAARNDYEFCVFELGSNVGGWMPEEEFKERTCYLLNTYAAAHPDKLAFVIDDLLVVQESHETLRGWTRECLETLGNPKLIYVDGHKMLPSRKYVSADFVHPTVDGHRVMADYLLRVIREHI